MVTWNTKFSTETSIVYYGTSMQGLYDQYNASWDKQIHLDDSYSDQWVRNVLLRDLEPDTTYYYFCGDANGGWSSTYSFRTKWTDLTYAVFGDFGLVNDQSLNQLLYEFYNG